MLPWLPSGQVLPSPSLINIPAFHSMLLGNDVKAIYDDLTLTFNDPITSPVGYGSYAILNSGNVMDNARGIFKAPVRGIYRFNFVTNRWRSYPSEIPYITDCTAQLIKNGAEVVTVAHVDTAGGHLDTRIPMYGLTTLLLEPGDTVSAKLMKQCTVVWHVIFNGFLIVPVPTAS